MKYPKESKLNFPVKQAILYKTAGMMSSIILPYKFNLLHLRLVLMVVLTMDVKVRKDQKNEFRFQLLHSYFCQGDKLKTVAKGKMSAANHSSLKTCMAFQIRNSSHSTGTHDHQSKTAC